MKLDKNDFIPFNGMVLLEEIGGVEKVKGETDKESFDFEDQLAQGKKRKNSGPRYKLYKIATPGIDCKPRLKEAKGKYVVVETAMVEEFVYEDIQLKVVSENYIVGMFVCLT